MIKSGHEENSGRPSPARIFFLGVGYVLALIGVLCVFTIPLYASLLVLVSGAVIGSLAYRPTPVMTWQSWTVLIGGYALILGVLCLFGDEKVRHWTPHPAGYIPGWMACFYAFRHIRFAFRQPAVVSHSAA